MKTIAILSACALAALPALASAAPDPCASGNYQVIRHSKIKPGGSLDGFAKAIADHTAWYRSHGYTKDAFSWGQAVAIDPATHSAALKPGEYVTIHASSSDVPREKQDAGWAAFVAEYAANSEIVSTTLVCMAK